MSEQEPTTTQPATTQPATQPDATPQPRDTRGDAPRERPTPEGDGLNPTRYGDWEKNGRCIDF